MNRNPLQFLELDQDQGLLPGHRFYRCPLCKHVTTGTPEQAFMLAGLHAGRHGRPGDAVIVPLSHQRPMFEVVAELDPFQVWQLANGELVTEQVDGEELVIDPQPAIPQTIAEFAFAVEVAAGAAMGKLFA